MLIKLGRSRVLPDLYLKKVSRDRLFEVLKVVDVTRQSGHRGNVPVRGGSAVYDGTQIIMIGHDKK